MKCYEILVVNKQELIFVEHANEQYVILEFFDRVEQLILLTLFTITSVWSASTPVWLDRE